MIIIERIAPDGTAHRITIRSHELIADLGVAEGGNDTGPDPHDLYDSAVAACKALTMVWYAKGKGIPLEGVRVGIERDASEERQGVYRLKTRIALDGPMSEVEHTKLIEVASKCPVHKLMTQVRTEIETIAV
ncbi:MAG: OsmC family protein [Sphingobium sp.]|nr:OsmC family protein [Sphingobium sp.]